MESVASNSPPPLAARSTTPNPFADRILRALRHPLRLLHRSNADFFILGSTGNVYTVTLSATPSCNCPDRTVPCKHILFVLLRVLGVAFYDTCLRRRSLRPHHLAHLLATPSSTETLAGGRARERFYELYMARGGLANASCGLRQRSPEEGSSVCPVCLEGMSGEEEGGRLVTCGSCGNSLHGECLAKWRRSRGRRGVRCVVCRARWSARREQEGYINLAAYVGGEDVHGGDRVSCSNNIE